VRHGKLNHRTLVDRIARFDARLHWLNLLLLLGVATLPFPTSLVAEYVQRGRSDASTATALYGLCAMLMALPWGFIWRHLADRPDLLEAGLRRCLCESRVAARIDRGADLCGGDANGVGGTTNLAAAVPVDRRPVRGHESRGRSGEGAGRRGGRGRRGRGSGSRRLIPSVAGLKGSS
jgi:hypothetical protein